MALDLTIAGSQTQASKLSAISSFRTSTPYQIPSLACFCLSLLRMLVASNPALSHSCLAMISKAFAMAPMMSCSLPATVRLWLRRYLLSSMSMAPPPATMESFHGSPHDHDGVVEASLGLLH